MTPDEVRIGVYATEQRAQRTVRWLRRAGLHVRIEHAEPVFEVLVPSGPEEREAHRVLAALEHLRRLPDAGTPTGWEWVRTRLLNLEVAGMVVAGVLGALLLAVAALWLWELGTIIGWLALGLVVVAGIVFFHFSGMPHSAVKAPRRFSHKHDITMDTEQQVQYRLAWARDEWQKSQRWTRRRRRSTP